MFKLPQLRGIRAQTAFVFGTLSVVLCVTLAVITGRQLQQQSETEAGNALLVVASNAARTLSTGLFERARESQVMAQSSSLWKDGLDAPQVRETLARTQANHPYSAWIGVTDAEGKVMAATGGLLEGKSVAKRPWFQAGLKAPYVGDLHLAQLLAALLPPAADGEPKRFVDFAAPITVDDKIIGVIGVHGSWEWAKAVIESLMPINAGELHMEAFIFDRAGAMIYAPRGAMTPEQASQQRLPVILKPGYAGAIEVTPWADGRSYLTAAAPVEPRSTVADLGWTVVAREPTSTAFADARSQLRKALLIGSLAALVAVTAAWVVAGMLSDPLVAMARVARDVERGEPGVAFPEYGGSREVEGLSHALSGMTRRLLASNDELEKRVAERTAELEAANAALETLARHDPLTGVLNRRAFEERIQQALATARRTGSPLSVLMIDADHFKSINDRFGHDVGDEVLKTMAKVMVDRLRETDCVARMGGEEFAILLPDTDDVGAELVAKSLLDRMRATEIDGPGKVTVSVGAATASMQVVTRHTLMVAADKALYAAKAAGRDCMRSTVVSGQEHRKAA